MKQAIRYLGFCLIAFIAAASPAAAQYDFIVRMDPGVSIEPILTSLGLEMVGPLDSSPSTTYLVRSPDYLSRDAVLEMLAAEEGISEVEVDELSTISNAQPPVDVDQSSVALLNGLSDAEPIDYFGTTVWRGYRNQPAAEIVGLDDFQADVPPADERVVAILDTGIDPSHPAFAGRLVGGYDFTRDLPGLPSELSDLDQSTVGLLNQSSVALLNQSSVALLNQSSVALLNQSTVGLLNSEAVEALTDPAYRAFGHGTMVAGLVHLVDPGAKLMPLKVFRADGTGYVSDIVRAINYAVDSGANVINMSFSTTEYSPAILRAINAAARRGVVCVSSAGNVSGDGLVYPAALANVIGTASTTDSGDRSAFSSFGRDLAWVSAPGEGLITTYPAGTYAAVWGTSFSAAMVSGAAAALLDAGPIPLIPGAGSGGELPLHFVPMLVQDALSHGGSVGEELGFARLNLLDAAKALGIYLYAFAY